MYNPINASDYEDYSNGQRKCAHRGFERSRPHHDYSLNNISWMAAPIDFVPVQFHEYGICHSDGEELHFVRQGKLKDFSIYDSVQEVKHREQEELAEKLRRVDKDGYFTIIGDEKNDRGNEHEIDIDEIFAGHIDFIIADIGK